MEDSAAPSSTVAAEPAKQTKFGGKPHRGGGTKGRTLAPRVLRDMQWGYDHAYDEVRGTPQQEHFRDKYRDEATRDKFVDKLTQAQLARSRKATPSATVSSPKDKPDEPLVLDAGTEKSLDVIERLIREEEEQNGKTSS